MAKKENIVSTTTQLEKAIESLAIHGGDHFAACFDNFLNLALFRPKSRWESNYHYLTNN